MSPKRGDRVTVPPPDGQWDVRFGTSEAATGWDELCRHALANTRRCLEILRTDPGTRTDHERQHRLRGDLATHRHTAADTTGDATQHAAHAWQPTSPADPAGVQAPTSSPNMMPVSVTLRWRRQDPDNGDQTVINFRDGLLLPGDLLRKHSSSRPA